MSTTEIELSTDCESRVLEIMQRGIIVNNVKPRWGTMIHNGDNAIVRYTSQRLSIGEILIAAIDQAIVAVAFENQDFSRVIAKLQTQFGGSVERDDDALKFATNQFEENFAGSRQAFELDTHQADGERFISLVQQQLATIPYGATLSYGELADRLGRPGAARAVGSACARNPIPLIQPCHRVVRADGRTGELSGTTEARTYLLSLERGDNPYAPTS